MAGIASKQPQLQPAVPQTPQTLGKNTESSQETLGQVKFAFPSSSF